MPERNAARLPEPLAQNYDWQLRGHCRQATVEFFVPEAARGRNRAAREDAAKGVCAACPSRRECLQHALAVKEPYGIWGGTTPAERVELLVSRPGGPGKEGVREGA